MGCLLKCNAFSRQHVFHCCCCCCCYKEAINSTGANGVKSIFLVLVLNVSITIYKNIFPPFLLLQGSKMKFSFFSFFPYTILPAKNSISMKYYNLVCGNICYKWHKAFSKQFILKREKQEKKEKLLRVRDVEIKRS